MIPDSTNVYGVIDSLLTKEEVARMFHLAGWGVSKVSWHDWEIRNDYSELVIDGDAEVLIHGQVNVEYFGMLAEQMKKVGLSFSLELYDDNNVLNNHIKHP